MKAIWGYKLNFFYVKIIVWDVGVVMVISFHEHYSLPTINLFWNFINNKTQKNNSLWFAESTSLRPSSFWRPTWTTVTVQTWCLPTMWLCTAVSQPSLPSRGPTSSNWFFPTHNLRFVSFYSGKRECDFDKQFLSKISLQPPSLFSPLLNHFPFSYTKN